MNKKVMYLMVLSILWIPSSGHTQLYVDPGSVIRKAEALTMTVEVATLHNTILRDTNRISRAPINDLIYDSEAEQHSDTGKAKQAEKKEIKAPARVALMIITLMVAVVVFITHVGDT